MKEAQKEESTDSPMSGVLTFIILMIAAWVVFSPHPTPSPSPSPATPADAISSADPASFRIVAESEVKTLQDAGILADFTQETGIQLTLNYRGPVDIRNAVSKLGKDNPKTVDAYWPGSSLWLPGSAEVSPVSAMKTYVVLAVDPTTARELGWEPAKGITASDLVSAIQAGKVNLAMTSASQSTPGAAFYLGMYTALSGKRVLTSDDLGNPQATQDLRTMLAGVDRSSQSIDHLLQVYVDDKASGAHQTNAIVIYESLATQMNKTLIARGQPPMTIFYVAGATAIADMPLRYVDNDDTDKLDQYQKLTAFLARPEVQKRIQALGWRTNPIGMKCDDCDPAVFSPDWGFNTTTEFQEMVFPKAPVTKAALDQYQTLFRKPSFTVYCLDYSPSMYTNNGRTKMIAAMDLLLDQDRAAGVSLQATAEDVTMVFGFATEVRQVDEPVYGNDPVALKSLSNRISGFNMSQATAMFDCVEYALAYIAGQSDPKYSYSIIALTDGGSNAGATQSDFARYYQQHNFNIPVYGIAFGAADFSQLDQFKMTGGDVYDGRQDVATAFRLARGNN
jgi:Ca-activated chloride channel family protein